MDNKDLIIEQYSRQITEPTAMVVSVSFYPETVLRKILNSSGKWMAL